MAILIQSPANGANNVKPTFVAQGTVGAGADKANLQVRGELKRTDIMPNPFTAALHTKQPGADDPTWPIQYQNVLPGAYTLTVTSDAVSFTKSNSASYTVVAN